MSARLLRYMRQRQRCSLISATCRQCAGSTSMAAVYCSSATEKRPCAKAVRPLRECASMALSERRLVLQARLSTSTRRHQR